MAHYNFTKIKVLISTVKIHSKAKFVRYICVENPSNGEFLSKINFFSSISPEYFKLFRTHVPFDTIDVVANSF